MPDRLNDEQQALVQTIRDFADAELIPRADRQDDPQARREVIAASQRAGLFGLTQPRAFGGEEAGPLLRILALETLAACDAPLAGAVFGPGPGVLAQVGEPLRSSYLAPLLRGDKRGGFGFTEPEDAPHPTRAERDGDNLLVTGAKSYVTGGGDADFVNTLVQVEDEGPALLLIDTGLPGVTLERRFESLDGSHHAAFRFDRVRVPAAHLIGTPGQGLPRAMAQIGDTRLDIAAQCCGLMLRVIGDLHDGLVPPENGDRGNAKGQREGIRLRYADLRIQTYAARSMLYRTARLAEDGANVINEGIACKVFASEAVQAVVDGAIQLTGGQALISDHPLARLYRRVRAFRLAEGGNDVLRLNLARGDLDLGKGRL